VVRLNKRSQKIAKVVIGFTLLIIFYILMDMFTFSLAYGSPGRWPHGPAECTLSYNAGVVCTDFVLYAKNGTLDLEVGVNRTINFTGVKCTMNTSYIPGGVVLYQPQTDVVIQSNSRAAISNAILNVTCTDEFGNTITKTSKLLDLLEITLGKDNFITKWYRYEHVGFYYKGKLYVNYTEIDTGAQKILVGSIGANYRWD
jgi:hypothetical protein